MGANICSNGSCILFFIGIFAAYVAGRALDQGLSILRVPIRRSTAFACYAIGGWQESIGIIDRGLRR